MKTFTFAILATLLGLACVQAQPGPRPGRGMGMGGPQGPHFDARTTKLFGENTSFSATLEMTTQGASPEETITMPGKLAFDQGKSRFEMDMSQMKGSRMSPQSADRMKSMGMDKIIMISRPDLKVTYQVYPGLQAYVETPIQQREPGAENPASDLKVETTELGKETVDGHPCIKNKDVVTDKEGKKYESTAWNATDLKNFPIKIEMTSEQGRVTTMLYKDISLVKPDASLFDPPRGFAKAANMMELMMRRGGMNGFPPGRPQPGQ